MPLPSTVRVKLSSEAAEAISLTPVVVQELAMRDLLEHILGVTGKDEARIGELILRGTLVSGASRFRWQGWQPDLEEMRALLATFPDPDPTRTFAAANCERATLRGGRQVIELARESASRKRFFQSESFWDALMRLAATSASRYEGYSYRDRCDRFVRDLAHAEAEQVRAAAKSVTYSTLRDQIRATAFTQVELLVRRAG
jgi:hypothetical protein